MSRSASQNIAIPGAQAELAQASAPAAPVVGGDHANTRIAELEAQVAALQAGTAKLPKVVFEPVTPHAVERLAQSATGSMTVAEVMAAIDDGRLSEPMAYYACRDGNYARRG